MKPFLIEANFKNIELIIKAYKSITVANWDFSYRDVIEANLGHIEANVPDLILGYCGPFNIYYGQCTVDIEANLILL